MKATQAQQNAIDHGKGNLQLIACAGSGKTEVVARRVARLLDPATQPVLEPRNIVALTFTERAATELRNRIEARTRSSLGEIPGMAELFVGTIHGFCLRLLHEHRPESRTFSILNDIQQRLLVNREPIRSGLTDSYTLHDQRSLERFRDTDRYLEALEILREDTIDWSKLEHCSVAHNRHEYENMLEEEGFLDYSSILVRAEHDLTLNRDVRAEIEERIKYLIVDEYQDVNPIQERIVKKLHELGAEVCVVGDDDQTIYEWRGSAIKNIRTFADRYNDVTRLHLDDNFRSSPGIVGLSTAFIAQNVDRIPKQMRSTDAQTYEPGDITSLEFASPIDEAEWIARTCRALYGTKFKDGGEHRGLAWSDMAILLRSVRNSGDPIIDALRKHDVPFVIKGAARLFETAEATALRSTYHYLLNDDISSHRIDQPVPDDTELIAAWRNADIGIGDQDLKQIVAHAQDLRKAFDSPSGRRHSMQSALLEILAKLRLDEQTIPRGRSEVVMFNIGQFARLIADYETVHATSSSRSLLRGFVGFLYYDADGAYPEGADHRQESLPNAVQIMTVHQAKGMQWPAVFVPALIRNRFPARRQGGASVWHLIPEDAIDDADRYRGRPKDKQREDERRLFYVAMTRSQKFLHMTWAPEDDRGYYYQPSAFWREVRESTWVQTTEPDYTERPTAKPQPKTDAEDVDLSFSDLRHFLNCPYEFKLRVRYGFREPNDVATGYGAGIHNALADIHKQAGAGLRVTGIDIRDLVDRHMRLPFASDRQRQNLKARAGQTIADYVADRANQFEHIQFVEKDVEAHLGNDVTVRGRMDLVEQRSTGETTIIDLKSNQRSQSEEISEQQLHTYVLGYDELIGKWPDFVEIYDLEGRASNARPVDAEFVEELRKSVQQAADAIRTDSFDAEPTETKCRECGVRDLCAPGRQTTGPSDPKRDSRKAAAVARQTGRPSTKTEQTPTEPSADTAPRDSAWRRIRRRMRRWSSR